MVGGNVVRPLLHMYVHLSGNQGFMGDGGGTGRLLPGVTEDLFGYQSGQGIV